MPRRCIGSDVVTSPRVPPRHRAWSEASDQSKSRFTASPPNIPVFRVSPCKRGLLDINSHRNPGSIQLCSHLQIFPLSPEIWHIIWVFPAITCLLPLINSSSTWRHSSRNWLLKEEENQSVSYLPSPFICTFKLTFFRTRIPKRHRRPAMASHQRRRRQNDERHRRANVQEHAPRAPLIPPLHQDRSRSRSSVTLECSCHENRDG